MFLKLSAWGMLVLAIVLWGAYGYLTIKLADEQALASAIEADAKQDGERASASARLHALIRDAKAEEELLEDLARTDVLTAVKTIEAAGKSAGARVTVGGATASQLVSKANSQAVKDLRVVSVTVNGEGSLQALLHAAELFEALPFISSIQSFELEELSSAATKSAGVWRLSVNMRIITTSPGI